MPATADTNRTRSLPALGAGSVAFGGPPRLMTVGELLARLQAADPLSPVVVRGQYGGYDCVHAAGPQPLKLNVNSCAGFGPHEVPSDGESADVVAFAIESVLATGD